MLRRNKKKNNKNKICGLIFFGLGFVICIIDFGNRYYSKYLENNKINDFIQNDVFVNDNNSKTNVYYDYIGVLEIPKINLKKGFYDIDSKNNDVSKGIEVIERSNMPNVRNGSLILASHSGNSKIAYFNKLDKLVYGDRMYIYYDNKKYEYKLINIYEVEKNGTVLIEEVDGTSLVLITCSRDDKNLQVVYISELVKVVDK